MELGLIAGEASGDILGEALVAELQLRYPELRLSGIGGDLLQSRGLTSLHPMERLSVMGFIEPLKRLPELLRIRRDVYRQQLQHRPSLFLGIDSPDFNLTIEMWLRQQGIKTAHLVSPSVWAWRTGRVKKIAKAVDLMLCLLPFEVEFYQAAGVPAVCVGHPMMDQLCNLPSKQDARTLLGLAPKGSIVAVLPGSRGGEVDRLMPLFRDTLNLLHRQLPELSFVVPAANPLRETQINEILAGSDLPVTVVAGRGREVLRAADVALLASGTASLEAMLIGTPMVIAYQLSPMTWQLVSRLAVTDFVGLPNILAKREVAPELLQDAATPTALADNVLSVLEHGEQSQLPAFSAAAQQIGEGFAKRAADALDPFLHDAHVTAP